MSQPAKDEGGVFRTMVLSGANLTEKAMGVPVGVTRTVRDEVSRAVHAQVDWLEGVSQSSFKVMREMLQRIDNFSEEAVDGLESVTIAVSKVVRGSGEAASEMVSRTAASLTGTGAKESSQKAAIVSA